MRVRTLVAVAALAAALPLAAFARGVGGFTWGEQYFEPGLAAGNVGITTSGVYGYSVTGGGQRYGGFALGVHADQPGPGLGGGFVGGIAGQELRAGPVVIAASAWTGFGGLTADPLTGGPGAVALFGEIALEAGFGFLPGVQVTGYAALQGIAPVRPDRGLFVGAFYTPVFGMRLAWGS